MKNSVQSDLGFAGKFHLVVKNADGTIKQDLGWQDNLITNSGLQLLNGIDQTTPKNTRIQNRSIASTCFIGSSSTEPRESDKQLGNYVAKANRYEDYQSYIEQPTNTRPNHVRTYFTIKYIFTGINNKNITELGLGYEYQDGDYVLYTHALLKNQQGTPTSITVLEGEILEINYELSTYWDIRPKRGEIALKSVTNSEIITKQFDYELRLFGISADYATAGIYPKRVNSELYSYGVDITKDTNLNTPYDFSKWAIWATSVANHIVAGEINKHTLGTDNASSSGYYEITDDWDYYYNKAKVFSHSTTDTSRSMVLGFSPYSNNHPNGIRAIKFDLGATNSITGYKASVLIIFAEKNSSKGIPKTENDILKLGLTTSVSRYTGAV